MTEQDEPEVAVVRIKIEGTAPLILHPSRRGWGGCFRPDGTIAPTWDDDADDD